MEIDYEEESFDAIIEKLEYAIEQHPSFLKVLSKKELIAHEEENQKRRYSAKN